MPPGTGDMAISLGQLLPRAEVLLVTTPQPLAQEVASRAAVMAQRTGQRLVGVVENMCGESLRRGRRRAARARARDRRSSARVPLDVALRESGDRGEPVVESRPDSASARALVAIAELVAVPRPGAIQKPLTLLT